MSVDVAIDTADADERPAGPGWSEETDRRRPSTWTLVSRIWAWTWPNRVYGPGSGLSSANFAATSQELDTIRDSLKAAEQRSNTDALTGLANRHSMDEFLRQAQIDAMEKDEALSVFLIDIDHFKKFNDDYGHQVGDQVLRLVAKVLQEGVREVDQ